MLRNETNSQMRAVSGDWFRVPASQVKLTELISKGIVLYKQDNPDSVDPNLLAGYIKKLIIDIPGGLIPDYIQKHMVGLCEDFYFGFDQGGVYIYDLLTL